MKLSSAQLGDRIFQATFQEDLCRAYLEHRQKPDPRANPKRSAKSISWREILLPEAHADLGLESLVGSYESCAEKMTSGDLLQAYRSSAELVEYNKLVQKELDAFKTAILARVKQRLPSCEPKVIDVPTLFKGYVEENKKTGRRYPAGGGVDSGMAIFPNLSNSVQLGESLIMPDPGNPAIRLTMEKKAKELGLKPEFIDTFWAHNAGGNLHCATNTIRYCRPRGGSR